MGGGQPTRSGDRTKALRAKGLYNADNTTIIKKSDENPLVLELYNGLLKAKSIICFTMIPIKEHL